ncbi:MAG TPA: hypothetical protein EYH05_13800 [Anaerolineae bacterium]|nr:hypothetical protein [Anaerolineae bacterium]
MRKGTFFLVVLALLFLGIGSASSSASTIPTISIVSVVPNQSVTIMTHNYPAGQVFDVRMNYMGTLGLGGAIVGQLNSGAGGSVTATYPIPDYLKGQVQIAIRADSYQGYYSFNWFWNDTSGTGAPVPVPPIYVPPGYVGIPTFSITAVVADDNVTITTNNFPPNQLFDVTIGQMYTQGIGGIKVGEIPSGAGGTITATFPIPDALKGQSRLSIRAQTRHANPYYAYNWFWNNTTGSGGQPTPPPGYTGIPTIKICQVVRDSTVEFQTYNYPPNRDFTVQMGPMGALGYGTAVGSFNSGAGGAFRQTFNIPGSLYGQNQISIRADGTPYYSFNWFWNNTTTSDLCN